MKIKLIASHQIIAVSSLLALAALPMHSMAQSSQTRELPIRNLDSSTWASVDALGRHTPMGGEVRPLQKKKFVGLFYFLTQGSKEYYTEPSPLDYNTYGDDPRVLRDNTRIIKQVEGDPVTAPQGWSQPGTYWWGQPAVGFFLADDPWVDRKNLQMIAEAGVDTLIFDVTNGPQYTNAFTTLMNTAEQMRSEGDPTPDFMFITYSSSGVVANQLYDRIYSKGLYKNLWFYWDGKPLIFGDPHGSAPITTPARTEVQNFFNWRYSWANTQGPHNNGQNEWEWIDTNDPPYFGWHTNPKVPEEAAVTDGAWSSSDIGRSFQGGSGQGGIEPPLDADFNAAAVNKGLFFSQEWRNALKIDPQFIFVTGWNEWTAGRQYNPGVPMLGQVTKTGQYYFVDEFNEEFSRDIMPMRHGFGDNYYMQLVDGIREFKGAAPLPVAHGFRTITLQQPFAKWKTVAPVFRAMAGGTTHRNWMGWGGAHYVNNTGRNDIIDARVACDEKNIYFYARTVQAITPHTGKDWMQMLIKTGQDAGWQGYNYVINKQVINNSTTTLIRLSDGKTWPVHYKMAGNQLMVILPRALLGLTDLHETKFQFHWIDHVTVGPGGEDPSGWWYDGDSAPDGRFNYVYTNME